MRHKFEMGTRVVGMMTKVLVMRYMITELAGRMSTMIKELVMEYRCKMGMTKELIEHRYGMGTRVMMGRMKYRSKMGYMAEM